jgi:tetratricopeptide (TPR) repeat protein
MVVAEWLEADGVLELVEIRLRSSSIERLERTAARRVFRWESNDGMFTVRASGPAWTLWIRVRAGCSRDFVLTLPATESLKTALFHPLEGVVFTLPLELEPLRGLSTEVAQDLLALASPDRLTDAQYWVDVGVELGRNNLHDAAIVCFERAQALSPMQATALNIAVSQAALGEDEPALARVDACDSDTPRFHVIRGNILVKLGRYAEAIPMYEEAIQREPDLHLPYLKLIEALSSTGASGQEFWVRRATFRFPRNPAVAVAFCKYYLREGAVHEIADAAWFPNLSTEEPDDRTLLPGDYPVEQQARYAKAIQRLCTALASSRLDSIAAVLSVIDANSRERVDCDLGRVALKHAGPLQCASLAKFGYERLCDQCKVGWQPREFFDSWVAQSAGEFARAVEFAEHGLSQHPEALSLLWAHWWNLEEIDALPAAVDAAKRYRAVSDGNFINYNIGYLLGRLGRHGEAADCYRAQLAITPNHSISLENLAVNLLHLKRFEEADGFWTRGLSLRLSDVPAEHVAYATDWVDSLQRSYLEHSLFARAHIDSETYTNDLIAHQMQLVPRIGSEMVPSTRSYSLLDLSAGHDPPEAQRYYQQLSSGDYSTLAARLELELPDWRSFPRAARTALLEAERSLIQLQRDYSPVVVSFGKSVEVVLRERVFVPFRTWWIASELGFSTLDAKDKNKLSRFRNYLDRGQPLELGTMLTVLEYAAGRTGQRVPELGELAGFVMHTPNVRACASAEWLAECKRLAGLRNHAAHELTCELPDALQARIAAHGLLRALTSDAAQLVVRGPASGPAGLG